MLRMQLIMGVIGLATLAGGLLAADAPSSAPSNPPPYLLDLNAFFRDLRLDRPELAQVKEALDQNDLTRAGKAYATWFRTKEMKWALWTDWSALKRDPAFDRAKADGLLAGHLWDGYSVYEVPATGIDWRKAPLTCLTRFPIFSTLLDAAFHTQEPKYATFLAAHAMEYIKAYPMAEFVGKGSFGDNGNFVVSSPWHWSMMPRRVEELSRAMTLVRQFPQVSDDDLIAILHRIYQEAVYCRLAMKRWVDKRHNGGKSYIVAMAHAGKLLADFKVTDEWSANNAALLAQYIQQSFYPDGQCVEIATSYSGSAAYYVQELASQMIDQEGIKAARPRLAAMVEWSIGISTPGGALPSFGDLTARDVSGTIYRPLLDWLDVPYAKTILDRGSGDENGPLPPHVVWPAPGQEAWAGYYAMRSDWTKRARYLCIDAGPRGTSSHDHGDKLSFVVSAYGENFVIDPTSTSYRNNEPDAFISTQKAGFLHNTVTVDGVDEFANEPAEAKVPLTNRWEHSAHHSLMEGSYSFAPVKAVEWKRRLVFADKSYWMLQDVLTGEQGAEGVMVEQNFQFEKGIEVEFDGARTIAIAPSGARLVLIPMVTEMKPTLSIGDEKPHTTYWPDGKPKPNVGRKGGKDESPHGRGWTGRSGNKLLPAPAVTYVGRVKLPAMLTILMVPIAPNEDLKQLPEVVAESGKDAVTWVLPLAKNSLRVETSPTTFRVRD